MPGSRPRIKAVQLYEKWTNLCRPGPVRASAVYTHLIHSPAHSLWGQLESRRSLYAHGLQRPL